MTDIKTPDCPRCGSLPLFENVFPYFCSNMECEVLSWEPTMTLAEIRATEPEWINIEVEGE